ncbi:MAG: TusE/DsrC/DsvC family sulfur relay protein [Chitinophagaceae bacterium]|nr:MAG: TusE/DsrC/DsvC family sulfur relay protein [Chitinophagaceae bacterium]
MHLAVNGFTVSLDKEGFLKNLSDWNKDVATQIALQEKIQLTDKHWEIINLLREFYQTFEVSPSMRAFTKYVNQRLGQEKGRSVYLLSLFPESPAKLASKIAGLPKPPNCL